MSELRVPTVALTAQVVCADGRAFSGRIFVPAAASRHSGPMRPEEWMNETLAFFPFLPDDAETPVILNKAEVIAISVPALSDEGDVPEGVESPVRRVVVECGTRRFEGLVVIDMPQTQSRVLDYLNRASVFLTLRTDDTHHLIQKSHITRVVETREG